MNYILAKLVLDSGKSICVNYKGTWGWICALDSIWKWWDTKILQRILKFRYLIFISMSYEKIITCIQKRTHRTARLIGGGLLTWFHMCKWRLKYISESSRYLKTFTRMVLYRKHFGLIFVQTLYSNTCNWSFIFYVQK